MFCKYAFFVFLSEIQFLFNLLHSILLFSVLFNEIFTRTIYQLSMYQNLGEFAQCTLFLNFNMKLMTTIIFLRFFTFPSYVVHLTFPPHILYCLSKVWSMLHHGSVGRVQNKVKNTLTYFQVLFRQFLLFFIKKFLFLSLCTL